MNKESVKRWRCATKTRIIEAMGGECQCCKYNACSAALDLHHINSEEKEFSFGAIRANPISWERIVLELRKCVLVCKNCHSEIHFGIRKLPENYKVFNEQYLEYKELRSNIIKDFKPKRKVERPSKEDLNILIWQVPMIHIGKKFGVSDNAIRKWCKSYGLSLPPSGYWNTKEYKLKKMAT